MNEEGTEAKEKAPEPCPEARCWVEKGMLRVEVPLFMANGEYIAYGMLHRAMRMAEAFFRQIERETKNAGPKIITPSGIPTQVR